MLGKWEKAVCEINNSPGWKATGYTYICSKHFPQYEYIIPPSEGGACRLKSTAVPTIFNSPSNAVYGIPKTLRKKIESPCDLEVLTTLSPLDAVNHDHNYCKTTNTITDLKQEEQDRKPLQEKLKRKVKSLQQQLRRTKARKQTMGDIIEDLKQKLLLCQDDAELLSAKFNGVQLAIFRDTKNNSTCDPRGRRYSDVVKEFAVTLNYYSPKAYEYVRSVIPLPQPSLIRKWSSIVECNPGFFKESFESLKKEALVSPEKKDCCLIIDGMAIRKQTLWDSKNEKYVGFVDYGNIPPEKPDQHATEALVFVLVGARSHWKCPVGYFLTDKMTGKMQAKLVQESLIMAAEAGLRVHSVTADGTAVNFGMFSELDCIFTTSCESMVTKFTHPTENYYIYAILDPCHMLKLARNALSHIGSIVDSENNIITWKLFSSLNKIQQFEGFKLANKFSSRHLQFQKHKMNVQLAAQTLSSSVADAIEFLDKSMKLAEFQNSAGTVKFIT